MLNHQFPLLATYIEPISKHARENVVWFGFVLLCCCSISIKDLVSHNLRFYDGAHYSASFIPVAKHWIAIILVQLRVLCLNYAGFGEVFDRAEKSEIVFSLFTFVCMFVLGC